MKRVTLKSALLLSALIAVSGSVQAYVGLCCGKCGGNMPLNIPGGGVPETREFRIKTSPMQMHMEGLKSGTESVSVDDILGMMPGQYMMAPTKMDMEMLNITAGYSFTDDFFAGIMLMWQRNEMEMKKSMMMGGGTMTMKSEGVADTMIMTKYRLYTDEPLIPKSQVSMLLGLSLPTGSIDEKDSMGAQLPYGMQLGSGSFDPTIGLLYQASSSPWWWGVNAMYTTRLNNNERDYRLGNEFKLDAYSMYQMGAALVAEFQLNASSRGDIRGTMKGGGMPSMSSLWDTSNYGGEKAGLTVGLQWQPVPLQIINLQYGKNIYSDLNGPQLEDDYRIMLTWYKEVVTESSRRNSSRSQNKSESTLGF